MASIVPQLRADRTWYIVDAGSTDGTWERVEAAALLHPTVTAVRHIRKSKVLTRGAGRRMAASLASSDILVHSIDADIVYETDAIERIAQEFRVGGGAPVAGDGYCAVSDLDYWAVDGHDVRLQVGEDLDLYRRLQEAGLQFRTKVVGAQVAHLKAGSCQVCRGTTRAPIMGRTSTLNPEPCDACRATGWAARSTTTD